MLRQSARSGLRPDRNPTELSPTVGNFNCRQRGSLVVATRVRADDHTAAVPEALLAADHTGIVPGRFAPALYPAFEVPTTQRGGA